MTHPIYKVTISIVLVVIVLCCLYFLFKTVPTSNKALQEINWYKSALYGMSVVGCVVGLLLLNAKIK